MTTVGVVCRRMSFSRRRWRVSPECRLERGPGRPSRNGGALQVPDGFRSSSCSRTAHRAQPGPASAWLREEATLLAEDEALSAWQLPP